jgi:hypothetical protein
MYFLKAIKIILLWVLALQILNMSLYCESYWFYFNADQSLRVMDRMVDPTETVVEWLVEMRSGQQDAFTYGQNNTDSKNLVKTFHFQSNFWGSKEKKQVITAKVKPVFHHYISALVCPCLEIITPPPDDRISTTIV